MTDLSEWTPRPCPERRVFEGRYARLEPLDPVRHGDDLYAASAGPGAEDRFRYLFDAPPDSRAAFEPWLARAAASDDPLYFAVVDQDTGRAEGRMTFMRVDRTHGVIETGNILGPRLARTRGATEAVYLQARHAFEDLGYRRFEWKCNDLNERSKRAAERLGFTFEGVFRQHMVEGPQPRHGVVRHAGFRVAGAQAGFRAWLSPDNFDEAGRQRVRLSACRDDNRKGA